MHSSAVAALEANQVPVMEGAPLGNLHIILFGDPLQHPPPAGFPLSAGASGTNFGGVPKHSASGRLKPKTLDPMVGWDSRLPSAVAPACHTHQGSDGSEGRTLGHWDHVCFGRWQFTHDKRGPWEIADASLCMPYMSSCAR